MHSVHLVRPVKRALILLIALGVLFSIPIAAKTWAAHGALAAMATATLVVCAVVAGPLSFAVAQLVAVGFVEATVATTAAEAMVLAMFAALLLLSFAGSAVRGSTQLAWYLPVMGWALTGAYFCISIVFAHTI